MDGPGERWRALRRVALLGALGLGLGCTPLPQTARDASTPTDTAALDAPAVALDAADVPFVPEQPVVDAPDVSVAVDATDVPDVSVAVDAADVPDASVVAADVVAVDVPDANVVDASVVAADVADAGVASPTLTGSFVGGAASGVAGTTSLRGVFTWHASVRGTGGGVTLEGWLQ